MNLNMKKLTNILFAGSLALSLAGCEAKMDKYLEGEVLKESESIANLDKSEGALFGNDSVKLRKDYVLIINTGEGRPYTIDVRDGRKKSISGLSEIIEVGSRVKFLTELSLPAGVYEKIFGEDRIGVLGADKIEVLGR